MAYLTLLRFSDIIKEGFNSVSDELKTQEGLAMDHWAQYWGHITQAAEAAATPCNMRDTAAVLAAGMMSDAFRSGRRIPMPTPELNEMLARAEELAG